MAAWQGWETAVLQQLGVRPTSPAVQFLDEWAGREGGAAAFNPLNTTLYMPGATSYNSVGVRNFVSPTQGAQATAQTLRGYPAIVAALQSGNPDAHAGDQQVQAEFLKWSGGGYTWPTSSGHVSMTPGAVTAPPVPLSAPGGPNALLAQLLLQNGGMFPQAGTIKASFKNPVVRVETKPPADLAHALAVARQYLDSTRGGFSNAGFAAYVHGLRGTRLPGSARGQIAATRPTASPKAGDLVFRGGRHGGVMVDPHNVIHGGGSVLKVSSLANQGKGALTSVRTVDGAGPVG